MYLSNVPSLIIQQEKTERKWVQGLDTLRFILASVVLLAHVPNPFAELLINSSFSPARIFGHFLGSAFCGIAAVMAFFIISGFVIHFPNRDGITSLNKFFIKRFTRLLIPLLIVMIAAVPFGSPGVEVTWSVYCELIYYTMYPLLLLVKPQWKMVIAISVIISIITSVLVMPNDVLSFIKQKDIGYMGGYYDIGLGYTWLLGLPLWIAGAYLAETIHSNKKEISYSKLCTIRLVIYILSVGAMLLRFHYFISYKFTMLALAYPMYKWIHMEILYYTNRKPYQFLEKSGKFSYSLYLCHPLFLGLLYLFLPFSLSMYFAYILLIVLGSFMFYKVIEQPSHALANGLSKRRKMHA